MHVARVGYAAASTVLGAAAVAMLAWAGSAGSIAGTADGSMLASPIDAPSAQEPTKIVTPADEAIDGAAREVASEAGLGTPGLVASDPPHVCGRDVGGWHAIDSVRGVDGQQSLNVAVSAWRAGAAVAAFVALVSDARECASPEVREGQHEFVASVAAEPGGGRRSLAALRMGDTLVIAEVATIAADPTLMAARAIDVARRVMRRRLSGRCVDPDSRDGGGLSERDPYGNHFLGKLVESRMQVPTGPAPAAAEATMLARDVGMADWLPPPARQFPDLAPLDLKSLARMGEVGRPQPGSIDLTDLLGRPLPRLEAPTLVDPALLVPPTDARPRHDPDPPPTAPDDPGNVATTRVRVDDPEGPGCGWVFALTQAPEVDPVALALSGRQAQIDALAQRARRQESWFVASAAWPGEYATWLSDKRAYNNWELYDEAAREADDALRDAQDAFEESVERWRSGDLPGLGLSSPGPSPSESSPAAEPFGPGSSPTDPAPEDSQ